MLGSICIHVTYVLMPGPGFTIIPQLRYLAMLETLYGTQLRYKIS